MATTPLLDNTEYEVLIPYIEKETDEGFSEYGYNFNIRLRTKNLVGSWRMNKLGLVKSIPAGIYLVSQFSSELPYIITRSVCYDTFYKSIPYLSTGVFSCGKITSPCDGQVIYISKSQYKNRWCMVIYIDEFQCIMIDNIWCIFYGFEEGSKVFAGDVIGIYYGGATGRDDGRNCFIEFAYGTNQPSLAPIRIWDGTYYKHDPTYIIQQESIKSFKVTTDYSIPGDQGFEYGGDGILRHSTPERQN